MAVVIHITISVKYVQRGIKSTLCQSVLAQVLSNRIFLILGIIIVWFTAIQSDKKKTSLCAPIEVVRMTLRETQREEVHRTPLHSVVSLNFSHSYRRLLCSYANCYGDEAIAPSFVRFTELLSSSFHCSVLRVLKIKSSPRCPGYWTCQAMKKRNTSFRGGSVTRLRESTSFCR